MRRCRRRCREIEPHRGEQPARRILLYPALDGCASRIAVRSGEFELCAGPRILDHAPAVAQCLGVVDEQHAGRALAGSLLELVGPTPIRGHGAALEYLRVLAAVARIVDQDHDSLAMHMHPRVIVPGIFWSDDAVTHEYHVAAPQLRFGHGTLGPNDHVLAVG